ncbi:Deoxycytidine_triphosphate deaminase [Hexamita inflata]|uniref:Deoxycytidine triphosphate deaminase n=1 Tax=Hexamita inflata TaxID=28002 RepID=A0AA86V4P2_9EUKA|nr:Deoxycytidine triphosphate deaminase [Hexamita inflata]
MTVLTRDVIKAAINQGTIKVIPALEESQYGPASIDLTLSNVFRKYTPQEKPVELTENYQNITEPVTLQEGEYIDLQPGEIILGITQEEIQLDPTICGLLEGRSRFARLGLLVHFTASIMAPGIKNKQVLEICNLSKNVIRLRPGVRICQFMFLRCEGSAMYEGRFQGQQLGK